MNGEGDMNSEVQLDELIEISRRKYELLVEILEITRLQSQLINENSLDKLNGTISEKQRRIDEITGLDMEFASKISQLKARLNIESLEELFKIDLGAAREMKRLVQEILAILERLHEEESKNHEATGNLLESFAAEIKKISDGKKLNAAYQAKQRQFPSHFIDKKK